MRGRYSITSSVSASSEGGTVRPSRSAGQALVGIDQVLLARCALAVNGDVREVKSLGKRHSLSIVAGEGGLQALHHALAQAHLLWSADLLQERRQQPAAHAPGHAVVALQLNRRGVEAAVNVDLLVRG